ncbi:MAG TPA: hypothetical protein VN844_23465 [Pyrinomonadaceae bacterium]|nr:hypothetical protein [Pyrinomonadaceae bacterium]
MNHRKFKETAGRLAQLFESEEGERILRLITRLSVPQNGADPPTEKPVETADAAGKIRVGTWEAADDANGRSFVRVDLGEPWHLWASVPNIPPKGPRRRIVLMGESAARGVLYDPQFNPALALQEMMNAACGAHEVEVIDLARTDLSHKLLQNLIPSALHLEPDALVIFCGNNWHPLAELSADEFIDMMSAFREAGSWRAIREASEAILIAKTKETLRSLEKIIHEHHIPVVFVLPEFNLADWRTECDCPPLLNRDDMAAWLSAKYEAEELLEGNQWERAETLGHRLMKLDEGTTSAGPNILAEISRRREDHEAAKTFLEMARDASISWLFSTAPRCFSVAQQTIREQADAHGVRVVDLPSEFTRYLGGKAAGRSLFLDYCHLNLEGIKLSMALTAETLLPLLHYSKKPWKELAQVGMKVTTKVGARLNAEAHFLAAVHNANWGQGMDIVRYHVRTALELNRGIARMMLLFLDFHVRPFPSSLCRSFEQLCDLKSIAAITLLHNVAAKKFLNTILITAIVDGLEEFGIPARADLETLLIQEHAVKNRVVDLVDPFYSTASFSRPLLDERQEFYKATARNTTFALVCDNPQPLNFTLTVKAPDSGPDQTISLRLNGTPLVEIPATDCWTTKTFSAPANLLRLGLNQVEISWPMMVWLRDKQREHIAECLEAGESVEITPMFGLIHSFEVSLARNASPHKTL